MKSDYFNLIESKLNGKKFKLDKHKHKKMGGVPSISPRVLVTRPHPPHASNPDPDSNPVSATNPAADATNPAADATNPAAPPPPPPPAPAPVPATNPAADATNPAADATNPAAPPPPPPPAPAPVPASARGTHSGLATSIPSREKDMNISAHATPLLVPAPASIASSLSSNKSHVPEMPSFRSITSNKSHVPGILPSNMFGNNTNTSLASSLSSNKSHVPEMPSFRSITSNKSYVPKMPSTSNGFNSYTSTSTSNKSRKKARFAKKLGEKLKFGDRAKKLGESAKNAYKKIKNTFSEIPSNNSRIPSNNSEIPSNNSQSPSYPYKLQVIPRHRNTEKKLSEAFDIHLEKIQQKIKDTSEKIDNQTKYVAEEQRILDRKKEILDNMYVTSSSERKERIWDIIKFFVSKVITIVSMVVSILVSIAKWFVDRVMSFIRWFFLLFVKFLIAIRPVLWAIMAIICVFLLILLIAWLIRGGRFELINNDGKDSDANTNTNTNIDIDIDLPTNANDYIKVSSSKNYGSSVTIPPWNWNNFIINPINYTFNYTLEKTLNNVNNYIDIPDVLNKIKIQNPIYTLRKNFKLLNNDNLKTDRIQNNTQREDNISFINYKLIDENIANEFCQVKEKQNKYHSISLIKPKNIEWELPHLDYTNTDMSKLPESIKNYKNSSNPNSLSLNEQSKIIFPWQYNNDEWALDCNTKFINNEFTGLYEDNGDGNCKATLQPATKHPPSSIN